MMGCIPGVGFIFNVANAVMYFQEDHYLEGILSLALGVSALGNSMMTAASSLANVGELASTVCMMNKVETILKSVGTISMTACF